MTNDELAAFYRRYNACCNEHRFGTLASSSRATSRSTAPTADWTRTPPRCEPLSARSRTIGWELRRLVVDAPWIAVQLTDTGTHRDTFLGVQATGRSVAVPEFAFYRVDAGRIAEVWGSAFHVHLLEQLR